MGVYFAEQAMVFLQSLLVGALLGVLYDVFRISRIAFPIPRSVIFVEDVLFFVICGIVTFFFGLTVIDGMLRIFLIFGELLGGVLYYFTVGNVVMSVSKKIIAAVKAVVGFVVKWVFRPIWMLFYHIIAFIIRPFFFLSGIFKKKMQNAKFSLKVRHKVLYNQLTEYLSINRTVKRRKGRSNEKTQKNNTYSS